MNYKKVVSGIVGGALMLYVLHLYTNHVYTSHTLQLIRQPSPLPLDYALPSVPVTPSNFTGLKKILYWNDFFGNKEYWFGVGQQPFLDMGCPVAACYATYDRDLFPLQELDALIFHIRSSDQLLPAQRWPHTRYVFFMEESPRNQGLDLHTYDGVFNYTMTYRRDSDVYAPYGLFAHRSTPSREDNINYAANKTKLVASFVSNCDASSHRQKVIEALQQYVAVDVFGLCGTLSCPKQDHDNCLQMLSANYKFFLSFENSLCKDYISEKFFGIIKHDVVLVVYGLGPYDAVAPPHSYINVLDYPSVRHLAQYLTYLASNDTAYNEYFR